MFGFLLLLVYGIRTYLTFQESEEIMPPKLKFAENEKVLCYHGPLLYEAKVDRWLCVSQALEIELGPCYISYGDVMPAWSK